MADLFFGRFLKFTFLPSFPKTFLGYFLYFQSQCNSTPIAQNKLNLELFMAEAHKTEWSNAQQFTISMNLFSSAKQHLQFLSAVGSTGCLYEGPILERAIYRYKNCWLPLLAKHMDASVLEGPLVVPLDCEWIWHCHRLNPLQYKRDCEKIYGKILGTSNVMSTTETPYSKQSELIWNNFYVSEPYNLDLISGDLSKNDLPNKDQNANAEDEKVITYDLVAAVKRQSTFFGKVSKDIKGVNIDHYLEAAVVRYKSFLHMIKTGMKRNPEINGVPTRDIDFIWHTHQLNPLAYYIDARAIVGTILDHNDRDIGTSEGKKMAKQCFERTKQRWEESFGNKYQADPGFYFALVPSKNSMKDNTLGCDYVVIVASNASKEDDVSEYDCLINCKCACVLQ